MTLNTDILQIKTIIAQYTMIIHLWQIKLAKVHSNQQIKCLIKIFTQTIMTFNIQIINLILVPNQFYKTASMALNQRTQMFKTITKEIFWYSLSTKAVQFTFSMLIMTIVVTKITIHCEGSKWMTTTLQL